MDFEIIKYQMIKKNIKIKENMERDRNNNIKEHKSHINWIKKIIKIEKNIK